MPRSLEKEDVVLLAPGSVPRARDPRKIPRGAPCEIDSPQLTSHRERECPAIWRPKEMAGPVSPRERARLDMIDGTNMDASRAIDVDHAVGKRAAVRRYRGRAGRNSCTCRGMNLKSPHLGMGLWPAPESTKRRDGRER